MRNKRFDIERETRWDLTDREKDWLKENRIKNYSWYTNRYNKRVLSFKYEEDAVAFKLTWL